MIIFHWSGVSLSAHGLFMSQNSHIFINRAKFQRHSLFIWWYRREATIPRPLLCVCLYWHVLNCCYLHGGWVTSLPCERGGCSWVLQSPGKRIGHTLKCMDTKPSTPPHALCRARPGIKAFGSRALYESTGSRHGEPDEDWRCSQWEFQRHHRG